MIEVLKLAFDLCCYYAVSGFYLYLITERHPSHIGLPLLALTAAAHIFLKNKIPTGNAKSKKTIKIMCCAIPAVFLLFNPSLGRFLQFLPAWTYISYSIWKDLVYTNRHDFTEHLGFTAKLLALILLGFVYIQRFVPAFSGIVVYLLCYLFIGVAMMRMLREEGKLSKGRTFVTLGLLAAAGICMVVLNAPGTLLKILGFIYQNVIVNIFLLAVMALGYIFYGIIFVFVKVVSFFGSSEVSVELDLSGGAAEIFGDELSTNGSLNLGWLETAATVAVVILIMFIVLKIFRRFLGSARTNTAKSPYSEETETLSPLTKRRRTSFFRPKDHRLAVRWYYRKYLIEGVKRGRQITSLDTSEDVEKKYDQLFKTQNTGDIRYAYIAARYQENVDVSEADVIKTGKLWKDMKNAEKPLEKNSV